MALRHVWGGPHRGVRTLTSAPPPGREQGAQWEGKARTWQVRPQSTHYKVAEKTSGLGQGKLLFGGGAAQPRPHAVAWPWGQGLHLLMSVCPVGLALGHGQEKACSSRNGMDSGRLGPESPL